MGRSSRHRRADRFDRELPGPVFEPARRAAGLPDGFRIHDLRCAALLIAQGAHAKEIAERLGHSSPVVIMTVYPHVLPSLDERLTDGLEETFRESSQQLWRVRP